ncbi:hypothetical protein D7030_11735 [Flavobacteriaceae bacterium AU392]|nr:hypothetical protein D1817_12935 [Flavobacteriaceae bacterium]RKM82823.1 hypothetical protein D7030_11735 [Flavobacteriaceae bacterium AU392]
MKKFLLNIVVFSALFFIVEKSIYFFIANAPNKEYDKRLEYILKGEMNKNLIVLGSSRGANNIIAEQLQNETGLTSYNLSYRGADIVFQEFLLKTLLKFNTKPKKVILIIDDIYEFNYEPTLKFRIDRLSPLKKYNYINNELIRRGNKNVLSKIFCLSRVNRKDFNLKKNNVLPINKMTAFGSKVILSKGNSKMTYKSTFEKYSTEFEQKEKLHAFSRIQELCKSNQIELIFIFPPNYRIFNTSFLNRFNELVQQENKIMIYDTLNPVYKNESYYRDVSHLMKNGAEIFTSEVSTFINNSN